MSRYTVQLPESRPPLVTGPAHISGTGAFGGCCGPIKPETQECKATETAQDDITIKFMCKALALHINFGYNNIETN